MVHKMLERNWQQNCLAHKYSVLFRYIANSVAHSALSFTTVLCLMSRLDVSFSLSLSLHLANNRYSRFFLFRVIFNVNWSVSCLYGRLLCRKKYWCLFAVVVVWWWSLKWTIVFRVDDNWYFLARTIASHKR